MCFFSASHSLWISLFSRCRGNRGQPCKFIWGLGVAIVIVVRPSNRIRNRKLCVTDVGLLLVKQQVGHQGSCRKRCCGTKSKLKHLKRCVNKCISQRWKQNGLSKQMLENMVYPKQMIHLVVEKSFPANSLWSNRVYPVLGKLIYLTFDCMWLMFTINAGKYIIQDPMFMFNSMSPGRSWSSNKKPTTKSKSSNSILGYISRSLEASRNISTTTTVIITVFSWVLVNGWPFSLQRPIFLTLRYPSLISMKHGLHPLKLT